MTLPTNWIFPMHNDVKSGEEMDRFARDLIFQLQTMYEQIAQHVNGDIKSDTQSQQENWIPTLNGSVAGTFTYAHQTGWVLRKGLMVDLFFDVEWSATTAGGNLFLDIPYKVATSSNIPFVGVLQPSNINFPAGTSYLVINAIPGTFTAEIWASGTVIPTVHVPVEAAGRIIGSIRYLGVANE